jgi:hypothetical protein
MKKNTQSKRKMIKISKIMRKRINKRRKRRIRSHKKKTRRSKISQKTKPSPRSNPTSQDLRSARTF